MLSVSVFAPDMSVALLAATFSPDRSTQNGAVVAGFPATAECNRLTDGAMKLDERFERPLKYVFTEHAERGAIYKAARLGVRTEGATLVSPWAACHDCARGIVQAGFSRLVRFPADVDVHTAWAESVAHGDQIMKEGGVEIVEAVFPVDQKLLRNGVNWPYETKEP